MSKQENLLRVVRLAVPAAALMLYVAGYVWYRKTLVAWWLPVVAAATIALLSLPMLRARWRWLTRSESGAINGLCHFYVAGALLYAGLLGGNYALADDSTCRRETVAVVGRTERTRREYRYLRHHRRVPTGKTIHTYCLEVVFADSTRKKIPVPASLYKRTRTENEIVLPVQRGFFGSPVIKERTKESVK